MIDLRTIHSLGILCIVARGTLALPASESEDPFQIQSSNANCSAAIQVRKTPVKGSKNVNKDVSGAVKWSRLDSGIHSGIRTAKLVVIRTEKEWQTLLIEHLNGRESTLPKIDFKLHNVVAYFMGTKSTGGYSVQITGIEVHSGKAAVAVTTASPPPGSMTIQVLTAPYAIVLSDKLPASVTPVVQEKSGK